MEHDHYNSLVTASDILSTVKKVYGQQATIINYNVRPATSSVQGFMSMILRVKVTMQVSPDSIKHSSFIVKRLPVMKEHLDIIGSGDFFDREIQYFNKAVPILKLKYNSPDIAVVQCYVASNNMIIMEDLCSSAYQTVSSNMSQVGNGSFSMNHIRLAISKLAQLHAASLGVNWLKELPFLQTDALFEGNGGKMMKSCVESSSKAIIAIIQEIYPNKHKKHINWIHSEHFYKTVIQYHKPNDKYLNVLCHGDFWENNMMFKLDDTNKMPLEVKLFDLQLARFARITTDFFYFLFVCTAKSFRDAHELEILETYVTAFNAAASSERLTLDELRKEYDEGRLVGAIRAATVRPLLLIDSAVPGEDEEMTADKIEHILFGIDPGVMLQQFREKEEFRVAMTEMVDELLHEMNVRGVV